MLRGLKKNYLPINSYFLIILVLVTVYYLAVFYDAYNYDFIDRDKIHSVLYKRVHPGVWKDGRPNCSYGSVLDSTRIKHAWDVRRDYGDFDIRGIDNGSYSPETCNPLYSVAILVTYRNRQEQLEIFLPYMHNFLRKQNIHYKIYLVEQQDDEPWNKGLLYNLGAQQAIRDEFPCLILHDVDLLPLDDANLYVCTIMPRHMSASVDKFRFVLPYYQLVGGVASVTSLQYTEINGFSNRFLEWGGEDDDFARRIEHNNLVIISKLTFTMKNNKLRETIRSIENRCEMPQVQRSPLSICGALGFCEASLRCGAAYCIDRFPHEMSRYTMLQHRPQAPNPRRRRVLAENTAGGAAAAAADGMRAPPHRSLRRRDHRLFTLLAVRT